MIYYALSTLMLADVKDICIISTKKDLPLYKLAFAEMNRIGLSFTYIVQNEPDGIASALVLSEKFLNGEPCVLILGDNLFYGHDFSATLRRATLSTKCSIFGYPVTDPNRYGIVEFNKEYQIISVEEKPKFPKSNHAITGLYFFDETAPQKASSLSKSARGEFEILDVIKLYLAENNLNLELMGRGEAWLDAGTHESLLDASLFVRTIERRQGLKIGCPEEIAWRKGWITNKVLFDISQSIREPSYSNYLAELPNKSLPTEKM